MRKAVTALVAAGVLLASGLAGPGVARAAGTHRRGRHAEPQANLGKKKETGLDQSLKANLKRKRTALPTGPTLQFQQFQRTVEVQVAAKRDEQIDTLTKIVNLGPSPKEAPGLIFRLAELYWEQARYNFLEAGAIDDKVIAAKGHPGEIARLKRQQAAYSAESLKWREKAVGRYRQIIHSYPKYARLDEVLFSLGSNLWQQNKETEALRVYKVLLRRFPNSEYLPDAYLAFGEHFFEVGKVRVALAAYKKAATYTQSQIYGFAMYKEGWCYYNLGEWNQAADMFKAVVFYGQIAGSVSGQKKLALVKQARRDYVLAYSHAGSPEKAKDDFQTVGGDHAEAMLRGLGDLYYDQGKDKESILVYRQLIKDQPLSPASPGYQARIVDAAQRIGNKAYTVRQARLLVRLFRAVEKSGVAKTRPEKQKLTDAREFAERTMRTLAVSWHSEAKKTRNEATFGYAKEMYGDYVTLFPRSKFAYEMHFYFGELLYHLEDYAAAARQYAAALDIDIARAQGKVHDDDGKRVKPGKFMVDAAFDAVLSYEEVAKKFEATEKRQNLDPTKPEKIPAPKQALLDACNRYLKYVPHGDKVVEVTYKAANIYYRYNHFDEAVKRFAYIALEHPEHQLAEYSANLVLDSYNLLKRPDQVNAWARKFYANKRLAKGKFATDLKSVIEESALTMIEGLEKKGQQEKAARAYEHFVAEFPHSKKADVALYNASVAYAKARELDRALAIRAQIIANYPGSKLVPQAILTTAQGYESVADFAKAAHYYELYANQYAAQHPAAPPPRRHRRRRRRHHRRHRAPQAPAADAPRYDEAKAQEALYNAAVLRQGLGDTHRAVADRELYARLWPRGKDTPKLVLSIADLYEDSHQVGKAVHRIDDYLATYAQHDYDQQLLLRLRQAKLLDKLHGRRNQRLAQGKYDEIQSYWDHLGRHQHQVKGGLLAVATAELRTVGPAVATYKATRLAYPWKEGASPAHLFAIIKTANHVTSRRQVVEIKRAAKRLKRGIAVADKAFKESIKAKSEKLKAAAAAYSHVVKYKQGAPALCALEQLGNLYADFEDALKNAPKPPYLQNDDQTQMFRDLLAKQAKPVEDKAVQAYATAVSKSRELMLYTPCAKGALVALQTLRPDAWPKLEEAMVKLPATRIPQRGRFLLTTIQKVPAHSKALPRDVAAAPAIHARAKAAPGDDTSPDLGDGDLPPPGPTTTASKGSAQPAPPGKKQKPTFSEPDDQGLVP